MLDGECATQPVGVERDGYKFAYWCVKTDTGVKMIDLSQPVTEDLTLYARWVSEGANSDITYTTYYNISFGIPDGYTEEDVQSTIMPEDQVIHEGALVYSLPTPYREGYAFVAWCSDGSLAKPISTEDVVTGDMVLYPMMVSGNDSETGMFVMMFTFDRPELSVDITENLQRITTIKDGLGMRLAFGVYVGIGVEVVNVLTNEVDSGFTLDMYITLEQELALDMDVTLDADVELFLGFIPTDAWARLDITFDVGTYSGIGIVATGGTEVGHTKEYIWDKLVKNDGSNGAFTSAESLADQLNDMLSQGDTSFFDQYSDKDGRSTLIQEYREMLQRETDYVDILALGRRRPFKIKIIPNVPVAEVALNPQFVFSAKLNVTLGTSFEYLDVKRYGCSLYMSLSDGARAWSSPVVDKQTPYHSLNLLMFGNVGVRAGFRLDLSIGVPVSGKDFLSKHFKLCELGAMLEFGVYADLYGFGYYHFDKNRATGATNIQKAGAFYLEMGLYVDIDLFANALLNLASVNFHILEMKKPFYKDEKREYIYDASLDDDVQEEYSRTIWIVIGTR